MKKEKKIKKEFLCVNGLYRTGSGALLDFLKGYENLNVIEDEFQIFRGSFVPLLSKIANGEDFTQEEFEEVKREWLNYGKSQNKISFIFNKFKKPRYKRRGYNKIFPGYWNITEEMFNELENARNQEDLKEIFEKYFYKLFLDAGIENEKPVFNQLIKSTDPFVCSLLPSLKTIIVFRDPRDHFCEILTRKEADQKFKEKDRAKSFVEEYSDRYNRAENFIKDSSGQAMKIRFEDLIFDQEGVREKIENFVDIGGPFRKELSAFDKNVSSKNTRIFEKHKFDEEIELIEEKLSDWLYKFPEEDI